MHDKVIDEILGIARQLHRLIDPRTTSDEQASDVIAIANALMHDLRDIFQPDSAQLAKLRDGMDKVKRDVMAEQGIDPSHAPGGVH